MNTLPSQARARQRGLSIVELMVGIAVGLFVVAAASTLVATQLSDNRRLMLETQVHQDLRAAADIVTREVRRSGYWNQAATQMLRPGAPIEGVANPRMALLPATAADSQVRYRYDRNTPEVPGPTDFGFRLDSGSVGAIRTFFGASGWQSLSDEQAVNITEFAVEPENGAPVRMACPKLCPGTDDTSCWPTIAVRELRLRITGTAVSDPQVRRTIISRARLRNDAVVVSVLGGASPVDRVACP